jgi:aspartate carbamoyltransferase regulatory subunit
MKKELAVAALKNGTVIDHIPPKAVFKIVEMLNLAEISGTVTIANNLPSSHFGTKGIIKVADLEFAQDVVNRIALIAPTAVINTIREYEVVKKEQVVLPDEIVGLVECRNPKCITRNEPMPTRFDAIKTDAGTVLRCHYCEHEINTAEL